MRSEKDFGFDGGDDSFNEKEDDFKKFELKIC